jgi:hypothetical protein
MQVLVECWALGSGFWALGSLVLDLSSGSDGLRRRDLRKTG